MDTKKDILTTDLRRTLKAMMQKELQNLPSTIEKLEPEQRLSILIKLMPFVLPRVNSVRYEQGEPNEYKIKTFTH